MDKPRAERISGQPMKRNSGMVSLCPYADGPTQMKWRERGQDMPCEASCPCQTPLTERAPSGDQARCTCPAVYE